MNKQAVAQELVKVAKLVVGGSPEQDAINAYGHAHGLKGRNLHWRSQWVSGQEAVNMARAAVPKGYNDFEWAKLQHAVRGKQYHFSFGREGSVVLYVKGFSSVDEVEEMVDRFNAIRADEISMGGKWVKEGAPVDLKVSPETEMRVWWD